MKKFTVDRKKWSRGAVYDNRLLRKDNKNMCCLGFFAKQILGLKDKDILERNYLCKRDGIIRVSDKDDKGFKGIINTNDDFALEDDEIEKKLKVKFAKLGYQVEFKG